MALSNYDFIKYDPKQMEHLARHLEGSETAGSHFSRGVFPTAKDLVDYAVEHIQDYSGQRLVREIDAGRTIGYDALTSLESLPTPARVSQEPRGKDGYLVNLVRGVEKSPTSRMVVVAGPLREQGKHGFYTIFPGQNAPSFPATREKLSEMGYSGEELEKQVQANQQYAKFWNDHGLIAD
jgi:hypothetical protein